MPNTDNFVRCKRIEMPEDNFEAEEDEEFEAELED